jgi:hypothetical protein
MKIVRQEHIEKADIRAGQFNNCEHLFIELAPGQCQTVSCHLPNGKHVTFAFVPGTGNEFECVDIHSTVGKHWIDNLTFGLHHYQQHLVGFSRQGDTFDTRRIKRPTSLATLLLSSHHHQ